VSCLTALIFLFAIGVVILEAAEESY
jgi:hypothetical protein